MFFFIYVSSDISSGFPVFDSVNVIVVLFFAFLSSIIILFLLFIVYLNLDDYWYNIGVPMDYYCYS